MAECFHCGQPVEIKAGGIKIFHKSWCPYVERDLKTIPTKSGKPLIARGHITEFGYQQRAGDPDGTLIISANIRPVPKPRMTRRDRWAGRPVVVKYLAYKDAVRLAANAAGYDPDRMDVLKVAVTAWFPMPKDWSESERINGAGLPHRKRPDSDNILKGICDILAKDDSGIYSTSCTKYWSDKPGLSISITYNLEE